MDYKHFRVEDFATDDFFVRWILENDPEAARFWTSYLAEHPEIAPMLEEARTLLLTLQNTKRPLHNQSQVNRVWEAIETGIESEVDTRSRFSFHRVAAAASILAIASIGVWLWISRSAGHEVTIPDIFVEGTEFTRQFNNTGHTIWIHLNDGTEVALENEGELIYKTDYTGDSVRRVYLEGEAFFKVAKNQQQPFLVYANEVVTKVLGTAFRVKSFNSQNNVLVSVAEGKVSVYSLKSGERPINSKDSEMKGVVLTSNQEVLYTRKEDSFNKSLVEAPQIVKETKRSNDFAFQNTAIGDVFSTLEEAYGVEIIYQEEVMVDCYLTVSLRDEPLFDKLKIICRTLGCTYELIDAKIVINSKGC